MNPTLPQLSGTDATVPNASPLLSFANTVNEAVNLAKKKRNESALGLMTPARGVAAASDFSSILSHMNQASDTRATDLIKEAGKANTPKFELREVGGDLYQIATDANGQVVGAPRLVKAGAGSSGVLIKSGTLNYTKQDYSEDSAALEKSRGADGWVDPTLYLQLFNAWKADGGEPADFISQFAPKIYVNPDNDWLPPYLRNTSGDSYNTL